MIEAERDGSPLLHWRDDVGVHQILSLRGRERVTIGREDSNDVVLTGDGTVSRTHAVLELVAGDWTVFDDGLSRNGTFVNGGRITQRRRLVSRDTVRVGNTTCEFRHGTPSIADATIAAGGVPLAETLTPIQRRVLVALCRPYREGSSFSTPASNKEIAEEVFLGVDAVKNHLRLLFQRFDLADLPQNEKRTRLVERAFLIGAVRQADFEG